MAIYGPYMAHIQAIYVHIWPYMAIYGPYMAMYGPYMAIYGHIWRYMGIYGHIWPYMAKNGHIWFIYRWPHMAIYGPYMDQTCLAEVTYRAGKPLICAPLIRRARKGEGDKWEGRGRPLSINRCNYFSQGLSTTIGEI